VLQQEQVQRGSNSRSILFGFVCLMVAVVSVIVGVVMLAAAECATTTSTTSTRTATTTRILSVFFIHVDDEQEEWTEKYHKEIPIVFPSSLSRGWTHHQA
jgi:hypothetical protein